MAKPEWINPEVIAPNSTRPTGSGESSQRRAGHSHSGFALESKQEHFYLEERTCHSMNIAALRAATALKRSRISAPNRSANARNATES